MSWRSCVVCFLFYQKMWFSIILSCCNMKKTYHKATLSSSVDMLADYLYSDCISSSTQIGYVTLILQSKDLFWTLSQKCHLQKKTKAGSEPHWLINNNNNQLTTFKIRQLKSDKNIIEIKCPKLIKDKKIITIIKQI